MKTSKHIFLALAFGFATLFLSSCDNDAKVTPQEDLLPQTFSVAIPSSLSKDKGVSGGRINGRTQEDTLSGNNIYQNLNTFIAVGEGASKIVEGAINGIRQYHIDRIKTLTFVSDDDNRTKNMVVVASAEFEGTTWDYELTVTDALSETEADGGKALQIFWNNRLPIQGIAIINPYNCDRIENANIPHALFRIDYSEVGSQGYDATMEVRIAGLPLPSPLNDPFAISSLHMFVGKQGDNVDVYGNSNHPNAILFTGTTGFDWAFVASGSDSKNIGVAEVGLPASDLDNSDREVLLKEYSIHNVFSTGIYALWPDIDPSLVANFLKNTEAPGYFDSKSGFLTAGVSPGADWDGLRDRTASLTPYNPKSVSELEVTFK